MLNVGYMQGRLVRDVDVRESFSYVKLACNRNYKNKDGQTEADFIDFKVFGDRAVNIAKYFGKGSEIIVQYHVASNTWDDRDGKRHYDTDLIIDSFQFTGGSRTGNGDGGQRPTQTQTQTRSRDPEPYYDDVPDGFRAYEDDDEDIPF